MQLEPFLMRQIAGCLLYQGSSLSLIVSNLGMQIENRALDNLSFTLILYKRYVDIIAPSDKIDEFSNLDSY